MPQLIHYCNLCSKAFGFKKDLRKHVTNQHGDALRFQCQHCKRRFFTEQAMTSHENVCSFAQTIKRRNRIKQNKANYEQHEESLRRNKTSIEHNDEISNLYRCVYFKKKTRTPMGWKAIVFHLDRIHFCESTWTSPLEAAVAVNAICDRLKIPLANPDIGYPPPHMKGKIHKHLRSITSQHTIWARYKDHGYFLGRIVRTLNEGYVEVHFDESDLVLNLHIMDIIFEDTIKRTRLCHVFWNKRLGVWIAESTRARNSIQAPTDYEAAARLEKFCIQHGFPICNQSLRDILSDPNADQDWLLNSNRFDEIQKIYSKCKSRRQYPNGKDSTFLDIVRKMKLDLKEVLLVEEILSWKDVVPQQSRLDKISSVRERCIQRGKRYPIRYSKDETEAEKLQERKDCRFLDRTRKKKLSKEEQTLIDEIMSWRSSREDKLRAIRKRCLQREQAGGRKYPRHIQKAHRTPDEEQEGRDAKLLTAFGNNPPTAGNEKHLWDEIMSWKPLIIDRTVQELLHGVKDCNALNRMRNVLVEIVKCAGKKQVQIALCRERKDQKPLEDVLKEIGYAVNGTVAFPGSHSVKLEVAATFIKEINRLCPKDGVYKGTFQRTGQTKWTAEDKMPKNSNEKVIRCYGNSSLEAAVRLERVLLEKNRLPKNKNIREALELFDETIKFHRIVRDIAAEKQSDYIGVSWSRVSQRWYAIIMYEGKTHRNGSYEAEKDAAFAVNALCDELKIPRKNPDIGEPPSSWNSTNYSTKTAKGATSKDGKTEEKERRREDQTEGKREERPGKRGFTQEKAADRNRSKANAKADEDDSDSESHSLEMEAPDEEEEPLFDKAVLVAKTLKVKRSGFSLPRKRKRPGSEEMYQYRNFNRTLSTRGVYARLTKNGIVYRALRDWNGKKIAIVNNEERTEYCTSDFEEAVRVSDETARWIYKRSSRTQKDRTRLLKSLNCFTGPERLDAMFYRISNYRGVFANKKKPNRYWVAQLRGSPQFINNETELQAACRLEKWCKDRGLKYVNWIIREILDDENHPLHQQYKNLSGVCLDALRKSARKRGPDEMWDVDSKKQKLSARRIAEPENFAGGEDVDEWEEAGIAVFKNIQAICHVENRGTGVSISGEDLLPKSS